MNFVIDDFNGPLDLLLYLVKEKKMDLLNIKLEIIIDEYLDIIHKIYTFNYIQNYFKCKFLPTKFN